MKGVIFNVLEEVVEEHFGVDFWDEAVERAGVTGAYTSLGSYTDDELVSLVGAIAELARVSRNDVLVLGGRLGFRHLASRHTDLLVGLTSWRDVLAHLDGIIHPEVKKIYPDAEVPEFDADAKRPADASMLLEYRSPRELCALAEGLVLGLGDWFDAALAVVHVSCVHNGDDVCRLQVKEA